MFRRTSSILAAILTASALPAFAQAVQTGTIVGKVSDPTGARLPAVSVTLSSPILITAKTTTTDSQGTYRFPGLATGTYSVGFELAGFRKLSRSAIDVSIGTTVTVDAALEVGQVSETVEVVGASSLVDTSQTAVSTNLDYEALQNLPTARDVWAILQSMAPQVVLDREDVGGSEGGLQAVFSAHGSSWHQNTYALNGADVTDPAATGATDFYFDYDSFQEVQVSTAQHSAEIGSPGVYFNLVARRGTDSFHGGAAYYFENDGLVSDNISQELRDKGITGGTQINLFSDATAQLGGPIVKDKLRFFTSWRDWRIHRDVLGFPKSENTDLFSYLFNVSYQINPKNRFDALYTRQTYYKPNRNASATIPPDSTWVEDDVFRIYQGNYNSQINDNALVDVRVAYVNIDFPLGFQPGVTARNTTELTTGIQSGVAQIGFDQFRSRVSTDASFSYFRGKLFGADHDFKGGYQFYRGLSEAGTDVLDGVTENLFEGQGSFVILWNTPVQDEQLFKGHVLYAQDTIRKDRLTFNVGLRFEHTSGGLPAQTSPAGPFAPARQFPEQDVITWNDLAPRLGVIYDILGSGKSALKLGYARYFHAISSGMIAGPSPNTLGGQGFLWNDDGDRRFELNERGAQIFAFGGSSITTVDSDLKRPRTDEISLGADFELPRNIKLSITGLYRKGTQLIALTEVGIPQNTQGYDTTIGIDPGPDSQTGTADDQRVNTFNLKPELAGKNRIFETNPEGFETGYKGIEITLQRRFADHWQGLLTYALSKADLSSSSVTIAQYGGEEEGAGGIGFGAGCNAFQDPNCKINNTDGPSFYDRTHILKLNLAYEIPRIDVNVAGVYKIQTGTPFGRIVTLATDANGVAYNQGPVSFFTEARDAQRFPTLSLLDLRASKFFRIRKEQRLEVILDVFNVFNKDTTTNLNVNTGTAFNNPVSILGPRVLRLGARYTF